MLMILKKTIIRTKEMLMEWQTLLQTAFLRPKLKVKSKKFIFYRATDRPWTWSSSIPYLWKTNCRTYSKKVYNIIFCYGLKV